MGRRLKHASSRLKGLSRSGSTGLWEARKAIPEALRPTFGKREFKAALHTRDENEAVRVGALLLADWTDQINAAKGKAERAASPLARQAIDRDRAYLAIQLWKSRRIKDALNLGFNGALEPPPLGFSDEMAAHVQMVGDLRNGVWQSVPDFDQRLSAALNEQGVACDPAHPAIPAMRSWFAEALALVEHTLMECRRGNLWEPTDDALSDDLPPVSPVITAPDGPPAPPSKASGKRLMELFDLDVTPDVTPVSHPAITRVRR